MRYRSDMRKAAILLLGLVGTTSLLAAAGCASKGGGPTGAPLDGFVEMQALAAGEGDGFAIFAIGMYPSDFYPAPGTCAKFGVPTPAPSPLDAGANVTLSGSSGGSPAITVIFNSDGFGRYSGLVSSGDLASFTFSLAWPGGSGMPVDTFTDVLTIPAQINAPASQTLNAITWTPVGADLVELEFASGNPQALFGACYGADTGSFTLPPSFASIVPSSGVIGFNALTLNIQPGPVSGNSILFVGSTLAESTY
jgi:hypothetical protein